MPPGVEVRISTAITQRGSVRPNIGVRARPLILIVRLDRVVRPVDDQIWLPAENLASLQSVLSSKTLAGGMSFRLPCGAPSSTHFAIVAIC